jgi:deoxyribonuclease (pyrimidine dimer)
MRCNVGVNPEYLADQHLIAEYRELPMILGSLRCNKWVIKSAIPKKFKLNKGHMNFLKEKLLYIQRRHEAVKKEMTYRKFKCDALSIDLEHVPIEFCNDWNPNINDSLIIRERIIFKLENKPDYWRFRSKKIDIEYLITWVKYGKLFYV